MDRNYDKTRTYPLSKLSKASNTGNKKSSIPDVSPSTRRRGAPNQTKGGLQDNSITRAPPAQQQQQQQQPEQQRQQEESQHCKTAVQHTEYTVEVDEPSIQSHRVEYSQKLHTFIPLPPLHASDSAMNYDIPDPERVLKERRDDVQNQLQSRTTNESGANIPHKNEISHIDRGVQTLHWPPKERGTSPKSHLLEDESTTCSSWDIYDAYLSTKDVAQVNAGDDDVGQGLSAGVSLRAAEKMRGNPKHVYNQTTHVVHRMLYQNNNSEIISDFKYWEDPADEVRPNEGTILPLWLFSPSSSTQGRSVTALEWNPKYADYFAVGYGSFDPTNPLTGVVAFYSLSDAEQPECVVTLTSSVLTMAFHDKIPCLLAVGCLDGSVHVIDISDHANPCVRASSSIAARHFEPVWQVWWCFGNVSSTNSRILFYAASSDGLIRTWEFTNSNKVRKKGEMTIASQLDGAACISAVAPHPASPDMLLIATQEGDVMRCSLSSGSTAKNSLNCDKPFRRAHCGPIYSAHWNPFHPTTFLTSSTDWNVRIWDTSHSLPQSVLDCDLGSSVADAAWSPAVSTVFAAITDSGRVAIYDLASNMHVPICRQKVSQKSKLTKLAWNHQHPILLVGDERGSVHCFKLSPNLRKTLSDRMDQGHGCPGTHPGPRRKPRTLQPPNIHAASNPSPTDCGRDDDSGKNERSADKEEGVLSDRAAAGGGGGVSSCRQAAPQLQLQQQHLEKVLSIRKLCRSAENQWDTVFKSKLSVNNR